MPVMNKHPAMSDALTRLVRRSRWLRVVIG